MNRVLGWCLLISVGLAVGCQEISPGGRPVHADPWLTPQQAGEQIATSLSGLSRSKPIAVLPFVDSQGAVRRVGSLLAESVEQRLVADGRRVMVRQQVNKLLVERDFQLAHASEPDKAKQAGALIGVDVLIVGKTVVGSEGVTVTVKAVDVATGRILKSSAPVHVRADRSLLWYVRRPARGGAGDGDLPPLSLRYAFVIPGVGGGEASLANGSTVRSQQKFKIRVQPNSDCHLYVLLYDSQGKVSVLFPHVEIKMDNAVRGQVSYEIPAGRKWYWFDDRSGAETFYLVASYEPIERLDALLAEMKTAVGATSQTQLAGAARKEIDTNVTSRMTRGGSAGGYTVRTRGVGGVTDVGWGTASPDNKQMDDIVTGSATVVRKLTLEHR